MVILGDIKFDGKSTNIAAGLDFIAALLSPYEREVSYQSSDVAFNTINVHGEILSGTDFRLFANGGRTYGVVIRGKDGKCDDVLAEIKDRKNPLVYKAGMMVDKTIVTKNRRDLFVITCTHSRYASEIRLGIPFNCALLLFGSMIENFVRLCTVYRTACYKKSVKKLKDSIFCQSYGVFARPFPSGINEVPLFFKMVIDDV